MGMIRMLDLFCGAGGSAVGYHRAFTAAGFNVDITGVDLMPQQHYPFHFEQGDAMAWPLEGYDFIHASPVCKGYSAANHIQNKEHPMLIAAIKQRLRKWSGQWIVENVSGARGHMPGSTILCGTQFGLNVYRHRLFESNVLLMSPGRCHHPVALLPGYVCIYGGVTRGRQTGNTGNHYPRYPLSVGQVAMGIDWMSHAELSQAIPPTYTEYLGMQIAAILAREAVD